MHGIMPYEGSKAIQQSFHVDRCPRATRRCLRTHLQHGAAQRAARGRQDGGVVDGLDGGQQRGGQRDARLHHSEPTLALRAHEPAARIDTSKIQA